MAPTTCVVPLISAMRWLREVAGLAFGCGLTLGVVAGCGAGVNQVCDVSDGCSQGGVPGRCIEGQCALPDESCPSGWLFQSDSQCVPEDQVDTGADESSVESEGDTAEDGEDTSTPDMSEVEPVCGDGLVEGDEVCDDENNDEWDGCRSDCTATEILDLELGVSTTCVVLSGEVGKCWGDNTGQYLGYGEDAPASYGIDEEVWQVPLLDIQAGIHDLALGPDGVLEDIEDSVTLCAQANEGMANAGLGCWGANESGQLLRGDTSPVFDPNDAEFVFQVAEGLEVGRGSVCVLNDTGVLLCWGDNNNGEIGLGLSVENIGDEPDEVPFRVMPDPWRFSDVSIGSVHTCAVIAASPLEDVEGAIVCMGAGGGGQLGYGATDSVGQNVALQDLDNILDHILRPGGDDFVEVAAGGAHTCAINTLGDVYCWGSGGNGRLGLGDTEQQADASAIGPVPLGDDVVIGVSAGESHTCALLDREADNVKCWGNGADGRLGYGDTANVGSSASNTPDMVDYVDLGGRRATSIVVGADHTCAVIGNTELQCWGANDRGQLGLGDPNKRLEPSTVPLFE